MDYILNSCSCVFLWWFVMTADPVFWYTSPAAVDLLSWMCSGSGLQVYRSVAKLVLTAAALTLAGHGQQPLT